MEIKGTAVLAIRDFVKMNYTDKFKEWLESLNEDSRTIYSSTIDSTKWYPVEAAAIEATNAIGKMFYMNDAIKAAREGGRYSAEKGLSGIYKIFVKASSPSFIISRAKDVFAKYYRPCEMKVVSNEPKRIVVHMLNATVKSDVIEQRIQGWMEKAMEISGAKDVQILLDKVENNGEQATSYTIMWK